MKKTDCRKCCLSDFKDALCDKDFCENTTVKEAQKTLRSYYHTGYRVVRGCQKIMRRFLYGSSISDMEIITDHIRRMALAIIRASTIHG